MRLTSRFSPGRLIVIAALLLSVISVPLVYSRNSRTQTRRASNPLPGASVSRNSSSQTGSIDQSAQISESGRQQIAALIAEKENRTPVQRKIDSQLLQAVRESRGQQMVVGVNLQRADVKADDTGKLEVDISAKVSDDLLARIQNLGGQIIYPSVQYNTIRAQINISTVESMAAFPEVRFIQPAVEAYTDKVSADSTPAVLNSFHRPSFAERADKVRSSLSGYLTHPKALANASPMFTGTITSEGDRTHRADDVRSTFGYAGEGVRIGVLSDSFNSRNLLPQLTFAGNLPGPGNPFGNITPVTVVQDLSQFAGTDEGELMLQIVHDIAPKAQLFFATAAISEASFATNILALRNAPNNCDIIIDDVGYFDEPAFQDGILAQAVNTVTSTGGLYFSSAGNAGSVAKNTAGVWEGDFTDAGSTLIIPGTTKTGTVLNFGTPGSPIEGNSITALGSAYAIGWSDPMGASDNDYDLFLMNSTLTTVKAAATNIQNGTQNPFERVTGQISVGDKLVVFKSSTAAVRAISLNTFRGTLAVATTGQTRGHSAAVDAFSVAATPASTPFNNISPTGPFPNSFTSSNSVENFSSDGPRRMFYNADGTAITPGNVLFGTNGGAVRNKPDLTAADGVTYDAGIDTAPRIFRGTSAAAPHAGAIAALLKSANPSLTPQQIRHALTSTALDIESTGFDINSGYGIIQAFQAMQSIQPAQLAHLSLGAINATEGQFSNHNGLLEGGEIVNAVVTLNNPSTIPVTNVKVTLMGTFLTAATVIQGSASYGTIPALGSASNATTPFTFAIDGVSCGTQIQLFLIVSYDGDSSPQQFPYTFNTGRGVPSISANLGQPSSGSDFTSITGQQTGILNRDGFRSFCGVGINPGLASTTGIRTFDAYTFNNVPNQCVTVTLTSPNGANLYVAAYNSGTFDPGNPAGSQLIGASGTSGTQQTFSFSPTDNSPVTIVVHEVNPGGGLGSPYTLSTSLRFCGAQPICAPITISPSSLPGGAVGVPYGPQTFTSSGGSGFNTLSIEPTDNLPAGISLSRDTLVGTPAQAGTFPIVMDVSDVLCPGITKTSNLNISGPLPGSIAVVSGDRQSAPPNTTFPLPLQVIVRDQLNRPMPGIAVSFDSPVPFAGSKVFVTDANGIATTSLLTGNFGGDLSIQAIVNGAPNVNVFFHLEYSCAPIVINNADSGPGSLRDVILNACAGSTVTFAPNVTGTISLTSGEIVFSKNLHVQGPGANLLAISGSHKSRIFTIGSLSSNGFPPLPISVGISGLTIRDGSPSSADTSGGGGGILVINGGLELMDSVVMDNDVSNAAVQSGGGIEASADLIVTRCAIIHNTARQSGGGINAPGGTISMTNSTVAGNTAGATGRGGGIAFDRIDIQATARITNSTIFGNSANLGGNISYNIQTFFKSLSFGNSIFAGGVLLGSSSAGPDFNGSGYTSLGFNLIQDTSSATISPTNGDLFGVNPLLLPLGNYGGPSPSMLPQLNSPVINNGVPSILADLDQRGFLRRPTGNSDIGAIAVNYALTATQGTPQAALVNANYSIPLQATFSQSGIPVSGAAVTFTVPSTGASGLFGALATVTAVTDSNGIATAPILKANSLTGPFSGIATINSQFVSPVSYNLTNLAQASISASSGTPQSVGTGSTFPIGLQANVRDAGNNPVQGIGVIFTTPANGPSGTFSGNVTSVIVPTDSNGIATATALKANSVIGNYTVIARIDGVVSPVSYSLTNLPVISSITPTGGTPQSAVVGATFPIPLRATVRDASSNPIAGINVTFNAPSAAQSGIFLGGVTAVTVVTDSSGVATAPAFTANSAAGAYSVTASVGGGVPDASFALTNIAAPSSISPTAGTPQSASLGVIFATAMQATVRDSSNNPLQGINVTFTAPGSAASGTFPSGALSTIVVTNASGVATAPAFKANSISGNYSVTAGVGGGVPVATFNLTNLAGPASILATAGTPQNAPPGTQFQIPLRATVRDINNNLLQGANVTFTAPDNGAGGTFTGGTTSATVVTDVAGVATAPAFTANAISGTYTVSASVGGNVTPALFSLRNVQPGPPASFTATAGTPQTVTIGCDFLTSLRATVLDADGVPVGGITVTFTVTPDGNTGATFSGNLIVATAITDNNGNATAPILTANQFAGSYTVTATITELAAPVTYNLTNRIKFGDLTGEGTVNVQDLLIMANALAGNIHLTPGRKMMADVFQDAGHLVNVQDLLVLANFLAGNITSLPVTPTAQNAKTQPHSIAMRQSSVDWQDRFNGSQIRNIDITDDQPTDFAIFRIADRPQPVFRISDLFWRPLTQVYTPTS